jgi:hypothetical protein
MYSTELGINHCNDWEKNTEQIPCINFFKKKVSIEKFTLFYGLFCLGE